MVTENRPPLDPETLRWLAGYIEKNADLFLRSRIPGLSEENKAIAHQVLKTLVPWVRRLEKAEREIRKNKPRVLSLVTKIDKRNA